MQLVDDYQILIVGQAYARYRHRGGQPLARPRYRRPNRRPKYACCTNQNETVALFCKVNAKRWCLLAEPESVWGHHLNQ